MSVRHLMTVLLLLACGCPGADFGFASPPRPAVPSIQDAPHGDVRASDVEIEAPDTLVAEKQMDERCPGGYVITDSDGPMGPHIPQRRNPHHADGEGTTERRNVTVRFRCTPGYPAPDATR
jgi:hypothetical protein